LLRTSATDLPKYVPNGPSIASVSDSEPILEATGVLVKESPQAEDSEK
jgi:hypothetical protein